MVEASPRLWARLAGAFYLGTTLAGLSAEMVARGRVIVPNDAAATARNLLGSESLYRWGMAADVVAAACYLAVTILLFYVLKPVSTPLSLAAASFSIIGITLGAASTLLHLAPLIVLSGASYLAAFDAAQLQALAYLFIKLHARCYDISLVFFGVYCVMLGVLIFRSTFIPRIIGVLMAIAGVSYIISSFAIFISPPLANALPDLSLPSLLGEAALTLWLLIFGVNVQKWEAQARLASRYSAGSPQV